MTAPIPKLDRSNRLTLEICILATLLAYWPLAQNGFVSWDDDSHIIFNPLIRGLDLSNLKWMFTNFHAGYWIPLTWLSLALDFWIGRLEPWVYHLDNLLLHCANTALVFILGLRFLNAVRAPNINKGAAAFGAALLFGLHPLHVESVAWAAERKDLLCGSFFLLSLILYLDYAARPQEAVKKYWICLVCFSLALLAKPMAVSLPVVFLILDVWPFGRLALNSKKILLEKTPFVLIALAASGMAVLTQFQSGAGWSAGALPVPARLMNAAHSLIFYLVKMVLPLHLTAFYPILPENIFSLENLFSVFLVLLITAACFLYRKKFPFLAAAWLYYVITLLPALGLVQVGNQACADRFTYLPSLAPFLLAASGLAALLPGRRVRLALLGVAILFGTATFHQVSTWKNTITLWENVIKIYPRNNLIVYQNLGRAYEDAGRLDDALAQYNNAIVPGYDFPLAHWGKGRIFSDQGRLEDSIQEYKTALSMDPHLPPLRSGLGMVYEKKGMKKEAQDEVLDAIRLDSNYPEAYQDLGRLYEDQREWNKAIEAFQKARALEPDNPGFLRDLLKAYTKAGQPEKALALYQELSGHPRSLLTMSF